MKRIFLGILLLSIFLSGCNTIQKWTKPLTGQQQVVICAEARIDQAYDLYGEAKVLLAMHYDDRDANHLIEAYYTAADSMTVARSLAKCPDRQKKDFFAMKNLLDLNKNLQKTVRLNMRDADPMNLIAIYRDQYYKIMPNDIR